MDVPEVAPAAAAELAALAAAVRAISELDFGALDPSARFHILEQLEAARRRQVAVSHDIVAGLDRQDPAGIGGPLHRLLADWLRVSCAEARRRIRNAVQLAPRHTLTGAELPPALPATAAAWHDGVLDGEHLHVIQQFFRDLPEATPPQVVTEAEVFLAEQAGRVRPDQLAKIAIRYAQQINPDGRFTDRDRAIRRGFIWSAQRRDGMSIGRLVATPELRANIDAWLARFAAPGMCNPSDETPCVAGEPTRDAGIHDMRSYAQRNHDALNALVRGQLGDPKLGVHHGLPVTVIVSTTLAELNAGAGFGVSAGGTLLPMRDLIRMAGHAYHYLAIFDDHRQRALYLGRTRRVASADQWVVLYARDRGCTAPNCDVPGYHTEAHHIQPWRRGGRTDINDLTLACHSDHLLTEKGWRTRRRADGRIEWLPPPQLGLPSATNDFHHPERYLPGAESGVSPDDHAESA